MNYGRVILIPQLVCLGCYIATAEIKFFLLQLAFLGLHFIWFSSQLNKQEVKQNGQYN